MLETFNCLAKLCRFRRLHIDGYVFRLHCTLTVLILMAFVVINSTKQLVGEPIFCSNPKRETQKLLDSWCYIRGIHSIEKTIEYEENEKRYKYLGVYVGLGQSLKDSTPRSNVYYQWIWFMLLFQSICFYFPRWLWKGFEAGKLALLSSNLDYFKTKPEEMTVNVDKVVNYLYRTNGSNDWYYIKYLCCELLALFNVLIQMAINQIFLLGQFWDYGYDWIQFISNSLSTNDDPMDTVFPIQSKCHFTRFGASGGKESLDFLCILPINVFNQKIYLFCWFWFIFLLFALSFAIIFRLILICCPLMRYYCCRYRFELSDKSRNQSRILVVNKLGLGDWFIIYLLGQNIEPLIFCEIIEKLCEKYQITNNYSNEENVYSVQEVSNM